MFLHAFADELVKTAGSSLTKTARLLSPRRERLVERMTATGALSSAALHGVSKGKAGLSANPYDGPEGSFGGALAKGAVGGLLAALGLKALGRFGGKQH